MWSSGFRPAPVAWGALAFASISTVGASARALSLQDIITRAEPAVAHLAIYDSTGALSATGSGFVIADHQLVTNHHVVEGAERIEASFQDQGKVDVLGVTAFDEAADIALLKLPEGTYPKLVLADAPARQGDSIVVIGSPMGFSGSVSTGIVSAVRPDGAEHQGIRQPNWNLQLTAAISPGSSGSPVLNESGDVVAVAVGVMTGQALNFAVPANSVRRLFASRRKEPLPVPAAVGGRTRLTNLLISAGALGGVTLVGFLVSWLLGRKRSRERSRGRDVIGSILKR